MHLTPWPDPLPAGIEVYRLDFDLTGEAPAARRLLLTPGERAKADKFARTADRVRFTETRAALRGLLARHLDCGPAEVPLAAGPHGKPFLGRADAAPLFNLAHSGSHGLIVLGDARVVREVGIDIEECKAGVDIEAVSSLAFTERECREVRDAGNRLHALYSRWVGKEAVLKAIGVGVAEHLKSIGIHPGADDRFSVECAVPEWTNFQAAALRAPTGYAAALAWRAKEST